MTASAQSLLGLVNQLHSMENQFTSILFETTLKLASLTDSSLFLLVETPEHGRRFAGKQHLCDAYLSGSLGPVGKEIHVEADLNLTSLQETNYYFDNSQLDVEDDIDYTSPSTLYYEKKKQNSKHNSKDKNSVEDLKYMPEGKTKIVDCKVKDMKEEFLESTLDCDVIIPSFTVNNYRKRKSYSTDSTSPPKKTRIERMEIEYEPDDGSDVETPLESTGCYIREIDDYGNTKLGLSNLLEVTSESQQVCDIAKCVMTEFFTNDIIKNKVKIIESIKHITLLQDKHSNKRKILTSLCYEFGLAFSVKYLKSDMDCDGEELEFPLSAFQVFWSCFPNLDGVKLLKVPYQNGGVRQLDQLCLEIMYKALNNSLLRSRKNTVENLESCLSHDDQLDNTLDNGQLLLSSSGKHQLQHQGFTLCLNRRNKNTKTSYFVCVFGKGPTKCQAMAATVGDLVQGNYLIKYHHIDRHFLHGPDKVLCQVKQILYQFRQAAAELKNVSVSQIYEDIKMASVKGLSPIEKKKIIDRMPPAKSALMQGYRARAKVSPACRK